MQGAILRGVRSYGQYCAAARALDVIGDRWSLLVVRELLVRGPSRFTDLRQGLPGVATNLLTARLRDLEEAGVLTREEAPPPVATTLYRLTPRGEALEPVLLELMRWGMPLMVDPLDGQEFRAEWAVYLSRLFLSDHEPEAPKAVVAFHADGQRWYLTAEGGALIASVGAVADADADAVIDGDPQTILGLITGVLDLDQALGRGLRLTGEPATLARVLPHHSA